MAHQLYSLNDTTPVRITPNGKHSGLDITIQNVDSEGFVYVGTDDTLTSSNYGYRILPSHAISFELNSNDALYIIGSKSLSAAVIRVALEGSGA